MVVWIRPQVNGRDRFTAGSGPAESLPPGVGSRDVAKAISVFELLICVSAFFSHYNDRVWNYIRFWICIYHIHSISRPTRHHH